MNGRHVHHRDISSDYFIGKSCYKYIRFPPTIHQSHNSSQTLSFKTHLLSLDSPLSIPLKSSVSRPLNFNMPSQQQIDRQFLGAEREQLAIRQEQVTHFRRRVQVFSAGLELKGCDDPTYASEVLDMCMMDATIMMVDCAQAEDQAADKIEKHPERTAGLEVQYYEFSAAVAQLHDEVRALTVTIDEIAKKYNLGLGRAGEV